MSNFDWRNADCWYVNLASRPDRNEHAQAQFAKAGVEARRFEGYLPKDWPGLPTKVARMQARTPGAIGCMMSQMHVMRNYQGGDRMVGVFEDDVVFCDDFQKRMDYIAKTMNWEWDILWLGATVHINPAVWHVDTIGQDAHRTTDKRILQCFGIWSTYAYFVNGKSVERVLSLLDQNMYRADGIDHCMIKYVEPHLKTYCFVPGCCWQYDNQSNIGNGVTEFSHFRKLGPYVWADRVEDFDPDTFYWGEASQPC